MFPYVVPYLPREGTSQQEEAFFVTGAGFAQHPSLGVSENRPRVRLNLGASLREVIRSKEDVAPIERRFVALLSAEREDLAEHLWRVVTFLESKEVEIDWRQFLPDLTCPSWGDVRREWASAFWIYSENNLAREREADTEEVKEPPDLGD
jgi:CRISPR type I-E-associated protein CasB/Cse2